MGHYLRRRIVRGRFYKQEVCVFGIILELFLLIIAIVLVVNLCHYVSRQNGFDLLFLSKWLSKKGEKNESQGIK